LENTVILENTDIASLKVDPHLTTKIVRSYVKHHTVGTGEVSELITSVHGALSRVGRPSRPEEALTPAVPVRQSVRHDYVVCLDCGYRGKVLRRHINKQHGLSPNEYIKRWGLRTNHPLTAPDYSEQRSSMAKELGLGQKVRADVAPAKAEITSVSAVVEPKSEAKAGPRRALALHRNPMSPRKWLRRKRPSSNGDQARRAVAARSAGSR
jgi:predicted transcriptional regulator